MPVYASQTDLEGALGGAAALNYVADPLNSSPQLAATVTLIASALEEATAIIDAHAASLGGVTGIEGAMWATTPKVVKQCCIALAIYFIYQRVRREECPEWVVERYTYYADPDKGFLARVAAGKLPLEVTEEPAVQNVGVPSYRQPHDSLREGSLRQARKNQLDGL